ncbi:hypothetical protein [Huintestinicola butyrica]|uniref:hypothetical protein n=1 Tax=Huintestinicola butyrica TaxID=2981728 RepID=UPI003F8148AC
MEKQIKSRQRVADHGEVYTAEREVKAMCDLVSDECNRIDSRFLEPACGDGNFLAEILTRKLVVVKKKYKKSVIDYEKNSLLAVSSIYGVDILVDNVAACRERLFKMWRKEYKSVMKTAYSEDTEKSVRFILSKNIVCGNALTLMCVDENGIDTDTPIIFSEWTFIMGANMQRQDFTFSELLNRDNEQTLLDDKADEGSLISRYVCNYRRLWENG